VNVAGIARQFVSHGYSLVDARMSALAQIYAGVQQQAALLAFLDCFWVLGIVAFIGPVLAIFIKKFTQGKSAAAH
jgi:DHA2 family multidrug resistance protein